MGEWMIAKTFKFPAWMLTRLDVEQQRLAPFARTQSETLRLLLQFAFHFIDSGSLERVLGALQDLQRKTVYARGMTLSSCAGRGQEGGLLAENSPVGGFDCRQAQEFLPIHAGLFGFQVPKKVEIGLGGGYARGKRAG